MRLTELISFVRQIDLFPEAQQRPPRGEPLRDNQPNVPRGERLPNDDPNAVPIDRQPVPPWIVESDRTGIVLDGGPIIIRDGGDVIIRVEQDITSGDLPDFPPNPPIDTLAYYLPFHLHGENWGIYLRESGILFAATIIKGSALLPSDALFIDLGHNLLLVRLP